MSKPERTAAVTDALSLIAVTLLSGIPYLFGLGFYSDDWGLLKQFSTAEHGEGLVSVVVFDFVARPVQGAYLSFLFKAFGLHPLGYHLVNIGVIAACAALVYLLLVRLRLDRAQSFVAAILFVMLPQLSTVRAWYSAFQIPLSLVFMLVSMHCQLSFHRSGRNEALIGAVVAAVISLAAYELSGPMLLAFALALATGRIRSRSGISPGVPSLAATGLLVTVVLAGVVYKLRYSGRVGPVVASRYLGGVRQFFRLDYDWRVDSSLNVIAVPQIELWEPVRGWWTGISSLAQGHSGIGVAMLAFVIGAIVAWRLASDRIRFETRGWKKLLFIGTSIFLVAHAIFLVVSVSFSPTGMDNRVQVTAAIGVAMIFAAVLFILSAAAPGAARSYALPALVVVVTVGAFARLVMIDMYWAQASAMQSRILSAARTDLKAVPDGSAVILDGICPYHGPAVVFETYWDVEGAFSLTQNRLIKGDVVNRRMAITPNGIETSIYKESRTFSFGDKLYVYDPGRHVVARLPDRRAAIAYFKSRPSAKCPIGFVARGVQV